MIYKYNPRFAAMTSPLVNAAESYREELDAGKARAQAFQTSDVIAEANQNIDALSAQEIEPDKGSKFAQIMFALAAGLGEYSSRGLGANLLSQRQARIEREMARKQQDKQQALDFERSRIAQATRQQGAESLQAKGFEHSDQSQERSQKHAEGMQARGFAHAESMQDTSLQAQMDRMQVSLENSLNLQGRAQAFERAMAQEAREFKRELMQSDEVATKVALLTQDLQRMNGMSQPDASRLANMFYRGSEEEQARLMDPTTPDGRQMAVLNDNAAILAEQQKVSSYSQMIGNLMGAFNPSGLPGTALTSAQIDPMMSYVRQAAGLEGVSEGDTGAPSVIELVSNLKRPVEFTGDAGREAYLSDFAAQTVQEGQDPELVIQAMIDSGKGWTEADQLSFMRMYNSIKRDMEQAEKMQSARDEKEQLLLNNPRPVLPGFGHGVSFPTGN